MVSKDDPAPAEELRSVECRLERNDVAVIVAADASITRLLGWAPEDVIGLASTDLINPEDQARGVRAWIEMSAVPGSSVTWTGRYRGVDGSWRWLTTTNTNRLDDRDRPRVETVMRLSAHIDANSEESVRASRELLTRLADALPVGVFHIDRWRQVVFTNDRFHEILGAPPEADVDVQFEVLDRMDRPVLREALATALEGRGIDGLELRFRPPAEPGDAGKQDHTVQAGRPGGPAEARVCTVSLRPLSADDGVVAGVVGCISDVTEGVRLRRELEHRASVDGLTGCLNRSATFDRLDCWLAGPAGVGQGLAVIFIDIDDFKSINDRYGHAAGDRVLSVSAQRIKGAVRAGDHVGRLGGDEFLVICPDLPNPPAVLPIAGRVRNVLGSVIAMPDGLITSTASIGIAWTGGPESPDLLVARADRAMYRAKRQPGTGIIVAA